MKKIIILSVSLLIGLGVGFGLGYLVRPEPQIIEVVKPGAATTEIQRTSKIHQTGTNTSSTTYATLYNGDATDRIIKSVYWYFQNWNSQSNKRTTAYVLYAATSTNDSSLNGLATCSTYCVMDTYLQGTTTNYFFMASSTPGRTGSGTGELELNRVWPASTYLNFIATGTTTADGIIGVEYTNN